MTIGSNDKNSPETKFWQWFARNSQHYYYHTNRDLGRLFYELKSQLNKIDENLTFELRPLGEDGVKQFIISADGIRTSFPAVMSLVNHAPKMDNWKVTAFRPRLKNENHISHKGIHIDYDDVYFRFAKDYGKIGLEIHIRGYEDNEDFASLVFSLLDQVLGEYDTETKLSRVEVIELEEDETENLFPIRELPGIVDGYIQEFHN